MRTSNSRIYAGGDCTAEGIQLTPVAILQGSVNNILDGDRTEADYTGIPSAVFTIPVLASVGISAANRSIRFFRDRSNWNTTRRAGVEFAASKVIIDEANDRIMGAHILGPCRRGYQYLRYGNAAGTQGIGPKKNSVFLSYICSDIPYML